MSLKTIKLPKILWKNTMKQFFPKRTEAEKQSNIDYIELYKEKAKDIEKLSRKRLWLP